MLILSFLKLIIFYNLIYHSYQIKFNRKHDKAAAGIVKNK